MPPSYKQIKCIPILKNLFNRHTFNNVLKSRFPDLVSTTLCSNVPLLSVIAALSCYNSAIIARVTAHWWKY